MRQTTVALQTSGYLETWQQVAMIGTSWCCAPWQKNDPLSRNPASIYGLSGQLFGSKSGLALVRFALAVLCPARWAHVRSVPTALIALCRLD